MFLWILLYLLYFFLTHVNWTLFWCSWDYFFLVNEVWFISFKEVILFLQIIYQLFINNFYLYCYYIIWLLDFKWANGHIFKLDPDSGLNFILMCLLKKLAWFYFNRYLLYAASYKQWTFLYYEPSACKNSTR